MNVKNLPVIAAIIFILIIEKNTIIRLFIIVLYLLIAKILYGVVYNDTPSTR